MSVASPRISVLIIRSHEGSSPVDCANRILAQSPSVAEVLIPRVFADDNGDAATQLLSDGRVRMLPGEAPADRTPSEPLCACRGEYLLALSSDILSDPDLVRKQAEFLQTHDDAIAVFASWEDTDGAGRVVGFRDLPRHNDELQAELLRDPRVSGTAVMIRRRALDRMGGPARLDSREQLYDLLLRLAEKGKISAIPEFLCGIPCDRPSEDAAAVSRVRNRAWRRRAWNLSVLPSQETLLAWARCALQSRRFAAVAALLFKAVLRDPFRTGPWRLIGSRVAWGLAGRLRLGKAAAIRNQNRIEREVAAGMTTLNSHPSQLMLLMIDKCNSKCVMCGGDYYAHSSGRRLTTQKVRTILDHLRPKFLTTAIFAGGGEPLLNPDFVEIAELTRRRCPTATLVVITNGIAFDESAARALVDRRIDAVVSVNAATAETYRRIMQVDRFERVIANVECLTRLAADARADVDVTLSFVATSRNIGELPEFVRLAKRLGADGVLVNYCWIFPEAFRHKSYDRGDNRLREDESLFFHQEESDRIVVSARRLAAEMGVRMECDRLFAAPTPSGGCRYAWNTIFAGFDGEVYWCPTGEVLFQRAVEEGRYASGNLIRQDISQIRNNAFFRDLRRRLLSREPLPNCAVCGNRIEWLGPNRRDCHLLQWNAAWKQRGERSVRP